MSKSVSDETSEPQDRNVVKILPPVDIRDFTSYTENGVTRGIGHVGISARWNFLVAVNVPGVTWRNQAFASITELFQNPEDFGHFTMPDASINSAVMEVFQVAPKNGHVLVRGYVHFDRELPCRISVSVA